MFRKMQILLLFGATVGLSAGCYQEGRRGEAISLDDEETPASQPTSEPTEGVTSAPVEATTGPAAATPATQSKDAGDKIRVIIETNFGHMEAELWPDQAPETVANFVKLARSGFYENLPSHRMLPGFIVQFGKPESPARARELKPIQGEFSKTLKHGPGTLSMARRQNDPDSATSQFFICLRPKIDVHRRALASLDGQSAIFGKVIRGLGVLDEIEAVPTTQQARGTGRTERSKPMRTILLRAVRIVE